MTTTAKPTFSPEPTASRATAAARPWFNRALWSRSFADARGLILGCAVVLFAFLWLFVWMTSQFEELATLLAFIRSLPQFIQDLIPIPISDMSTYAGMISMGYMDPVVLFTLTIYAIARGSDIVSGQLDRGTMEMLLAQPVRRMTLFCSHAGVTVAGAFLLAAACWLGTLVGLSLVEFPGETIAATKFIPSAVNLLAFTFFLAALTSLVSSWQRYRWQTISWVGGFYIVQLILKVVSRSSPDLNWLARFTFFGAFEPATLGSTSGDVLALSIRYDGLLMGMGLVAYALATLIYCRRDLPAPL